MELANKLANKLADIKKKGIMFSWHELNELSLEHFNEPLKKGCGACLHPMYNKLNSLLNKNNMNSNYSFKKEYQGHSVVLKANGVKTLINEQNLTDELAELMVENGYSHILNVPSGIVKKSEVKKLTPEVFNQTKDKPLPTLSTLKEAQTDGNLLVKNVSESVLITENSEPLTEQPLKKKRGRPAKV